MEKSGGNSISNSDVLSISHGLVLGILVVVSSQVERDVCVLESGIAGKSVYFCSRSILVVILLKELSTLVALFIFEILSINT